MPSPQRQQTQNLHNERAKPSRMVIQLIDRQAGQKKAIADFIAVLMVIVLLVCGAMIGIWADHMLDKLSAKPLTSEVLAKETIAPKTAEKALAKPQDMAEGIVLPESALAAPPSSDDTSSVNEIADKIGTTVLSPAGGGSSDDVPETDDKAHIHALYARQLAEAGKGDAAIKEQMRAVAFSPHDPRYRLDLAVMQDRAGHLKEAAELYAGVISALSPDDPTLASVKARLEYLKEVAVSAQ